MRVKILEGEEYIESVGARKIGEVMIIDINLNRCQIDEEIHENGMNLIIRILVDTGDYASLEIKLNKYHLAFLDTTVDDKVIAILIPCVRYYETKHRILYKHP